MLIRCNRNNYYTPNHNLLRAICLNGQTGEETAVADPVFWIRGVKFQKFRPKLPILCNVTVSLHFT